MHGPRSCTPRGARYWAGHVEADIETLRIGYEAFSRGDWDSPTRFAHPEFEFQTADRVVDPGLITAPRRYGGSSRTSSPFEEVVVEPEEFFEFGDQIVVFVRRD